MSLSLYLLLSPSNKNEDFPHEKTPVAPGSQKQCVLQSSTSQQTKFSLNTEYLAKRQVLLVTYFEYCGRFLHYINCTAWSITNFTYFKTLRTPNLYIGGNIPSLKINLSETQWVSWVTLLQKPQDEINCIYYAFVVLWHASLIQSLKYWLNLLPSKAEEAQFFSSALSNRLTSQGHTGSLWHGELLSPLLSHMPMLPFPSYSSSLSVINGFSYKLGKYRNKMQ